MNVKIKTLKREKSLGYFLDGTTQLNQKEKQRQLVRPASSINMHARPLLQSTWNKSSTKLTELIESNKKMSAANTFTFTNHKPYQVQQLLNWKKKHIDAKKIIAKNPIHDKEYLQKTNLDLKSQANFAASENTKLRTKIQRQQHTISNLEDLVKNLRSQEYLTKIFQKKKRNQAEQPINIQDITQQIKIEQIEDLVESNISLKLRKENEKLKEEIEQFTQQLRQIKSMINYTKMQELQKQVEEYEAYIKNIKILLEQQKQLKQINYYFQPNKKSKLKLLKTKNFNLIYTINELQQELAEQKKQNLELQNECRWQNEQIDTQSELLKEKDKRYKQMLLDNSLIDDEQNQAGQARKRKATIKDYQNQLNQRAKIAEDLQEKYEEQQKELKNIQKLKFHGDQQILTFQKQVQELEAQLKNQELKYQRTKEDLDLLHNKYQEQQELYQLSPVKLKGSNSTSQKNIINISSGKKNLPIQLYELEDIKLQLKYTCINARIYPENIRNMLFPNSFKQTEISISQLIKIFSRQPYILSAIEREILSRYLVETNSYDYIPFEPSTKQNTDLVIQIFKQLIGNFTILPENEEKELYGKFSQLIMKNESTIKDQFNSVIYEKRQEYKELKLDKNLIDYKAAGKIVSNFLQFTLDSQKLYFFALLYKIKDSQSVYLDINEFFKFFNGNQDQLFKMQTICQEEQDSQENNEMQSMKNFTEYYSQATGTQHFFPNEIINNQLNAQENNCNGDQNQENYNAQNKQETLYTDNNERIDIRLGSQVQDDQKENILTENNNDDIVKQDNTESINHQQQEVLITIEGNNQ